MARPETKARTLARMYVATFPDAPAKSLADKMYGEHPLHFKSAESARSYIRNVLGLNGDKIRKQSADKSLYRAPRPAGFVPLPESLSKPQIPYNMPQGKTLVLADVHMPYHDDNALKIALDFADKYKPDNILYLGDLTDFYQISDYERDPERRRLSEEIILVRQFLAHMRGRFPKSHQVWKLGNHDARWERYLRTKSPELCGCDFVKYENVFKLDDVGVDLVASRNRVKFGKYLTGIHGHELKGNAISPVSPARTMMMSMHCCVIGGHSHKTSQQPEVTADGLLNTAWSIGCLSEIRPDYMPVNQWNWGIATVELHKNEFDVANYRIFADGKIRQ